MQKNEPTPTSAPTSPTRLVNSPEFRQEMVDELKDWVAKGHCKLAPGNYVVPTPSRK